MTITLKQEVTQIEELVRKYYPHRTINSVVKMTGDASLRKYYRIKMDDESYIACVEDDKGEKSSTFVEVQKILFENEIRVPRVVDYRQESGFILEEDLGDLSLLNLLARVNKPQELYQHYASCIDQLIRIHRIDWKRYPNAPINHYEFDEPKFSSEVGLTIENFIRYYLKASISIAEEEKIRSEFSTINSTLARYKQVLCHRDYHSRNIMFKGKELVVIDFQDARRGPPSYDLASLLEDSYYTLKKEDKNILKRKYWDDFLSSTGHLENYSEFEEQYNLMACQRIFKAIGSFSYIYRTKSDARYLKYIGSSFDNLIEYMDKVPMLSNTKKLIRAYYYDS